MSISVVKVPLVTLIMTSTVVNVIKLLEDPI